MVLIYLIFAVLAAWFAYLGLAAFIVAKSGASDLQHLGTIAKGFGTGFGKILWRPKKVAEKDDKPALTSTDESGDGHE